MHVHWAAKISLSLLKWQKEEEMKLEETFVKETLEELEVA